MSFLLDTNIVSELARSSINPGVARWAQSQFWVYLSVITVEEILYGLSWKPNARILSWFDDFLEQRAEVLPVSVEVARAAGVLRGQLQARGVTRSQADMFIAATASHHGITLVTRNSTDFEGCGIALLNPFT